jgi:hypothetical protein
MGWEDVDWIHLAGSCELANKPLGSIKGGQFLDHLRCGWLRYFTLVSLNIFRLKSSGVGKFLGTNGCPIWKLQKY